MSDSYSISLEGIRSAGEKFDLAARIIADGRSKAQPAQTPATSDRVELSSLDPVTVPSANAPVDFAAEIVTIIEAKFGFESNLKVTAAQQELDRSMLDLFA